MGVNVKFQAHFSEKRIKLEHSNQNIMAATFADAKVEKVNWSTFREMEISGKISSTVLTGFELDLGHIFGEEESGEDLKN